MIYEVENEKRYGVTEDWDRSPSAVVWCPCGAKIYLSAEVSENPSLSALPGLI